MNLLHIKRRIYNLKENLKQKYPVEILSFSFLIFLLFIKFMVFPTFKFLLRIPDQLGQYKVLTFNNNNGQTFYVTGLYTGGWKKDVDNYWAKDTFKVKEEAVKFME